MDPVRSQVYIFANFYGYQRSDGKYVATKVYSVSLDLWFFETWEAWPFPPVATRGYVDYYRYIYSVSSNIRGTIFSYDSGNKWVSWTSNTYTIYPFTSGVTQEFWPSHDLSSALSQVYYNEILTFTVSLYVSGYVATTWPYNGGSFSWCLATQVTLYGS